MMEINTVQFTRNFTVENNQRLSTHEIFNKFTQMQPIILNVNNQSFQTVNLKSIC